MRGRRLTSHFPSWIIEEPKRRRRKSLGNRFFILALSATQRIAESLCTCYEPDYFLQQRACGRTVLWYERGNGVSISGEIPAPLPQRGASRGCLRGSVRGVPTTRCLAVLSGLQKVDGLFAWAVAATEHFDFWLTGGAESVDTDGVFSLGNLSEQTRL
jgi:hypothetical protein